MIKLTRLNNKPFYINPDMIEMMESQPDTMVTLTNGNKVLVKENPDEVVNIIIEFQARILSQKERCSKQ